MLGFLVNAAASVGTLTVKAVGYGAVGTVGAVSQVAQTADIPLINNLGTTGVQWAKSAWSGLGEIDSLQIGSNAGAYVSGAPGGIGSFMGLSGDTLNSVRVAGRGLCASIGVEQAQTVAAVAPLPEGFSHVDLTHEFGHFSPAACPAGSGDKGGLLVGG